MGILHRLLIAINGSLMWREAKGPHLLDPSATFASLGSKRHHRTFWRLSSGWGMLCSFWIWSLESLCSGPERKLRTGCTRFVLWSLMLREMLGCDLLVLVLVASQLFLCCTVASDCFLQVAISNSWFPPLLLALVHWVLYLAPPWSRHSWGFTLYMMYIYVHGSMVLLCFIIRFLDAVGCFGMLWNALGCFGLTADLEY